MPDPMSPSQVPFTAGAVLTAPSMVGGGEAVSWAGQVLLDHTAHREQRLRAELSASGPRLGHRLTQPRTLSHQH